MIVSLFTPLLREGQGGGAPPPYRRLSFRFPSPTNRRKLSKSFNGKLVHRNEAFWHKKRPLRCLDLPPPDEKMTGESLFFAHTPCFCAHFLLIFGPFLRFCKHALEKKGNAKFFCGVDFLKPAKPFFRQKSTKLVIASHLANPFKI